MVEEAGQVLEAHILASLVPSGECYLQVVMTIHLQLRTVRHLICIGDPRQLRPSLATYGMSSIWHPLFTCSSISNVCFSTVHGQRDRKRALQVRPFPHGATVKFSLSDVSDQRPTQDAPNHLAFYPVSLWSSQLRFLMLRASMQRDSLPEARRQRTRVQVSRRAGCAEGRLLLQSSAQGERDRRLGLKIQYIRGKMGQPVRCELVI